MHKKPLDIYHTNLSNSLLTHLTDYFSNSFFKQHQLWNVYSSKGGPSYCFPIICFRLGGINSRNKYHLH